MNTESARPDALTEQLLDAARKAGAEAADALVVMSEGVSVSLHDGAFEQAERAESIDLGLRIMIGQKQACVSVSDMRPETITAIAERAVAMAKEAPDDPWVGLATPEQFSEMRDATALDLLDPAEPADPAELRDSGERASAAARAVDGISQVSEAEAGWSSTRLHLRTSAGFDGGYARGGTSQFVTAIAGEGTSMERDYFGESRVYAAEMPPPEEIGRRAAERTIARIGSRKPPTGAFPVLYDERVSSSLIGHLVSAINGRSIARGASWAKDLLGERVLPKGMDLIEDPTRVRIAGSRPFDGEGLPTRRRHLVEDGFLAGWTLDLATARQLGMESTGNAGRGVSAPPAPVTGNLDLTQGELSRANLVQQMGTGLIVTSMIGATINPNTGHYSRGASGLWVENGEVAYPVNECTIAGNLRDMLKSAVAANDARQHLSRRVPSLLIEGLTIAGA